MGEAETGWAVAVAMLRASRDGARSPDPALARMCVAWASIAAVYALAEPMPRGRLVVMLMRVAFAAGRLTRPRS